MSQSVIKTEFERNMLIKRIQTAKLPCTVTIKKGAARSVGQNRLQRKWVSELAEQGDMTPEEYRGFCKLHFGVAIAKENDEYAEKYDRLIKPMTYEEKMELMMEPMDFPVTRIMGTEQKTRYLDKVYTYWTGRGFVLTTPEEKQSNAA